MDACYLQHLQENYKFKSYILLMSNEANLIFDRFHNLIHMFRNNTVPIL